MKLNVICILILTLGLITSVGFAQVDVDNPDSTRMGGIAESPTVDELKLNTVVECVRLIDAYIPTSSTTFNIVPKIPTNAGGELTSQTGAITFKVDYTTNCLDNSKASLPGQFQHITAGLSTTAAAPGLSGLSFQFSPSVSGAIHSGPTVFTIRNNGTAQNNTVEVNAAAEEVIKDIRNVTTTNASVDLNLDDNEFNFAQATAGTTLTVTFTLKDQ